MTASELQDEIARREAAVAPMLAEIEALKRQRNRALSCEFIAANRITRDKVQMSAGDDIPHFSHIRQFIDWMRLQADPKPWAEWNLRIYSTAELFAMRMDPNAPAVFHDVPA